MSSGSSSGSSSGGSDGGSDLDGGVCGSLANTGPVVHATQVAATVASATGGVLASGTYYMTSDILYTGAGGATGATGHVHQDTLVIAMTDGADGTFTLADDTDGTAMVATGRVVVTNSVVFLVYDCPQGKDGLGGFSGITPQGFTLQGSTANEVLTWTEKDSLDGGAYDAGPWDASKPPTCKQIPLNGSRDRHAGRRRRGCARLDVLHGRHARNGDLRAHERHPLREQVRRRPGDAGHRHDGEDPRARDELRPRQLFYIGTTYTLPASNAIDGAVVCNESPFTPPSEVGWYYTMSGSGAGATLTMLMPGSGDLQVFTKQ